MCRLILFMQDLKASPISQNSLKTLSIYNIYMYICNKADEPTVDMYYLFTSELKCTVFKRSITSIQDGIPRLFTTLSRSEDSLLSRFRSLTETTACGDEMDVPSSGAPEGSSILGQCDCRNQERGWRVDRYSLLMLGWGICWRALGACRLEYTRLNLLLAMIG